MHRAFNLRKSILIWPSFTELERSQWETTTKGASPERQSSDFPGKQRQGTEPRMRHHYTHVFCCRKRDAVQKTKPAQPAYTTTEVNAPKVANSGHQILELINFIWVIGIFSSTKAKGDWWLTTSCMDSAVQRSETQWWEKETDKAE